jgi:hypothetical protein
VHRPEVLRSIIGDVGDGNLWMRWTAPGWPFVPNYVYYETTPDFSADKQCQPGEDGEAGLWALTFEKIFAARFQSFYGTTGIAPVQVLDRLGFKTGGRGGFDYEHNPQTAMPRTVEEMQAYVQGELERKHLMFCGTGAIDFGGRLVPSHWYFVLGWAVIGGVFYVLMGNPWGMRYDVALPIDEFMHFDEIQTGELPE